MKQPIAILLAFAMLLSVFGTTAFATSATAYFEQGSGSSDAGIPTIPVQTDNSLINDIQAQIDHTIVLPTPLPFSDSQIGAESAVVQVNVFAVYKEWVSNQLTPNNGKVLGDPNAPVTIVEYADFECPFCAQFWEQTFSDLKREFIDTGIAKLEFRHFPPGFHSNARNAAVAAECAAQQNQFWKMHELLFQNQANLSEDIYRDLARQAGLNMEKFEACYQSEDAKRAVERDYQNGVSQGVSGTPSFFVNGQSIVGAQPFSVFAEAIKKAHSRFLYEDGYRKTYQQPKADKASDPYRIVTKPLAGAQVYLVAYNRENDDAGRKIVDRARTNADGQTWFKVSGFDESNTVFSVVVMQDGFTPAHSEKFELDLGQRHEVNIRVTPLERTVPPKPTEKPSETYWYRYAYWQCHDGLEQKQGGDSSCKPAELWSQYAQEFCQKSCNPDTGQCGVKTFQVDGQCKAGDLDKPKPTPKPIPRFVCDGSTTCELVHKLIERVDALEKRVRQLEEIISLRLGIQLESQPIQITAVEPTRIETSQGVIEATADTVLGVENGQPFVSTKDDPSTKKTLEDPALLKEIVAKKLAEQGLEATRETKYRIEPMVADDGSLDYKIKFEIKNQTPIINWIVPTQAKEFEVKATEIRSQAATSGLVEDLLRDPALASNVSVTTASSTSVAN